MKKMDSVSNIVIGNRGQIGTAIQKILKCDGWDIKDKKGIYKNYDVVHVCIPYFDGFVAEIKALQKALEAKVAIIHSTVPVGTCRMIGDKAVHSPCRGVHPNLEKGIRTFVKYFGGKRALYAAQIFAWKGISVKVYADADTTEAIKLWDTTQYGKLILLEKEIHEWCEKHQLPFEEIYTEANKDYNKGYITLGRPEVVRPYLKHIQGKIGGHCVLPNAKLLGIKLDAEI